MAPTKINDYLKEDDEEFIARKVKKMMYFWPRKLKRNSRRDYKKKITLAYRILKHNPVDSIEAEGLLEKFDEAFKALGSSKPKYQKDIFNKLMAFEKFKKTEPTDDFPNETDEDEPTVSSKDKAWKELKKEMLGRLYKDFTNKYREEDEEQRPSQ